MSASHPDPVQPGRCTLLGIDGAAMAQDKTLLGKMAMIMQMGMRVRQLPGLIGRPGFKAETRPEVLFTFTTPPVAP